MSAIKVLHQNVRGKSKLPGNLNSLRPEFLDPNPLIVNRIMATHLAETAADNELGVTLPVFLIRVRALAQINRRQCRTCMPHAERDRPSRRATP